MSNMCVIFQILVRTPHANTNLRIFETHYISVGCQFSFFFWEMPIFIVHHGSPMDQEISAHEFYDSLYNM